VVRVEVHHRVAPEVREGRGLRQRALGPAFRLMNWLINKHLAIIIVSCT
jgi:hypothetical protein